MRPTAMRSSLFVSLLASTVFAGAQVKPLFQATSNLNGAADVIAIDNENAASLAPEIAPVITKLPVGSFMLVNKRDKPIMAVHAYWKYTDSSGVVRERSHTCDGYTVHPTRPIVESAGRTLITSQGCAPESVFPKIVSGATLGSVFEKNSEAVLAPSIRKVEVTIDSVIFQDGAIAGPDKHAYSTRILQRDAGMRAVVNSLNPSVGDTASADPKVLAAQLATLQSGGTDQLSQSRAYWVRTLQHSPNLKGTMDVLSKEAILPQFYNLGSKGDK